MKFKKSLSENIIKKVIRESLENESNKSDWSWVEDVDPFTPGDYFDHDDICFNSDTECKVNINQDNITFVLDYDDWEEFSNMDDDTKNYLEPYLIYGPNYDGGGDYYDFDTEEFDYSGYQLTEEQKQRFQKILNIISPGNNFHTIINNDDMNGVEFLLKYEPLQDLFIDLRDNYLNIIGYYVQKNRWLDNGRYFSSILEKIKSSFKLDYDEIIIKVDMTEIFRLHENNISSLTDILKRLSNEVVDQNWYDGFYQEWDTSGGEDEINNAFNQFLDKAEKILDDEDAIKPYQDFINLIESLGFKPRNFDSRQYTKEDPNNDTTWYITHVDYENQTLLLNKHKFGSNLWSTPINQYKISFNQLPEYISN